MVEMQNETAQLVLHLLLPDLAVRHALLRQVTSDASLHVAPENGSKSCASTRESQHSAGKVFAAVLVDLSEVLDIGAEKWPY
jgi:hypothetical protein